jgi:hypothetical protein
VLDIGRFEGFGLVDICGGLQAILRREKSTYASRSTSSVERRGKGVSASAGAPEAGASALLSISCLMAWMRFKVPYP